MVKSLEKRQDQWVNTLIKPQKLSQARLYAIDSRIKEGELTRIKDMHYMRDTLKKLIYAIEQNAVVKGAASGQNGGGPGMPGSLSNANTGASMDQMVPSSGQPARRPITIGNGARTRPGT